MADPYAITIFVQDGDPEGVRVIGKMNWTGRGIVFPRTKWADTRNMPDFKKTGVYILVGSQDEDESDEDETTAAAGTASAVPIIYIGQGDGVIGRIGEHEKNKDFWEWAIVFVSAGNLNRAHITWLEYALIKQAREMKRCRLDNSNVPQEPGGLSDAEKADARGFLKEILQILPLTGLRVFEMAAAVATPRATTTQDSQATSSAMDTIIVPAREEGFEKTFLGENCWYAIRISGGMLDKIKYIAAYQIQPKSAITYFAPVDRIEPYGDGGKYKVIFSEKAQKIEPPILFADAPIGSMQGPRYTSLQRLKTAKKITDLFRKP